jgi:hypothetical protein
MWEWGLPGRDILWHSSIASGIWICLNKEGKKDGSESDSSRGVTYQTSLYLLCLRSPKPPQVPGCTWRTQDSAYSLTAFIYGRERILKKKKISKWKKYLGQSLRRTRHQLLESSPIWITQDVFNSSSSDLWQHMKCCLPEKGIKDLVFKAFMRGFCLAHSKIQDSP